MKMKLLLLGICLYSSASFSQNSGSVTGSIKDMATKEAIPYATITIKSGEEILTGDMTNEEGKFTIKNIPYQTLTLEVEYIGFKNYSTTITVNNDKKDITLGDILLSQDSEVLEGLEIIAERSTIEQLVDRKVINVGKDLTTAGATAAEIMNNIPSVNVDQDGNISLRGNENVRVLVDGKPTNMDAKTLLKQIPSTSIKKIELITNPSAKYNPEGMSGIINIELKKNTNDGFNGSYDGGITFAKEPKYNQTIDLNYRKGKFNFFGNYGYMNSVTFNDGTIEQIENNATQLFHIKNDSKMNNFKVGFDFYLNDKNTLSFYTNQNYSDGFGIVDNNIIGNNTSPIRQYDRYDIDTKNQNYNIAYKHLFAKEGHTLDIEGNYNTTSSDQFASFNLMGNSIDPYNDKIKDEMNSKIVNIDYVNPLSENSKLEIGAEMRLTGTDNTYDTTHATIQDANFEYNQDIYSFYATFGQKINKFSYQLGARLESYKVEAAYRLGTEDAPFKDDYFTVYPSAFLSYQANDRNMFQISLSRRVDRPSIGQTKPIREFSTPRVISVGNPELRPQFTNSVEFNYTHILGVKGSITAGTYYRAISDAIQRTFEPDLSSESAIADDRMIMSYGNFDKSNAYGFELSANYKIAKWWDIQPSFEFYNITQKGIVTLKNQQTGEFEMINREVEANAINARLNNNFKITQNLRASLFGFYRGPVDAVNAKSKEMYKIDAGLRYAFNNNRASVSLRFNDIFNTMKYGYSSDTPFITKGEFTWESQSLYVGFNYMFGGKSNRAIQRKYRENNEVQKSGSFF